MINIRTSARISFGLGMLSILAILVSHLALTDLWHGESDSRLEWRVLQITFAVIILFNISALITLGRFLRRRNQHGTDASA